MKVKIYSTKWCAYCTLAKNFFKENKIAFDEVDVEEDPEAAQEMVEKSGQMGIPVIEIGDKIIVGFNVEAIKKELKIK